MRILIVPLLAALALAACNGAAADKQSTDYVEAVARAQDLSAARIDEFGNLFGQAWPIRERLVSTLLEAGVGTAFDGRLAALEELDPPEEYVDGHRILLAGVQDLVLIDKQAAAAVAADDMVAFVIANGQLGARSVELLVDLPKELCELHLGPNLPASTCEQDVVEDGSYESAIAGTMRDLQLESFATAGALGFPLSLTSEEQATLLEDQLPKMIDLHAGWILSMDSLSTQAPSEYADDHAALREFLQSSSGFFESASRDVAAGNPQRAASRLLQRDSIYCANESPFQTEEFRELLHLFERCE